jgi:hypothetical protein
MRYFGGGTRRWLLTAHVLFSVGWVGAVGAFLAVAAVGWAADDATSAGMYAALDVLIWFVIVPLSGLSLVSGVVQSLGTPWGLIQHYWVLVKLVLTVFATAALLLHTRAVSAAAEAAQHPGMDFAPLRMQLVVDASAALVVLVLLTVVSIVKPRGTTPWARSATR